MLFDSIHEELISLMIEDLSITEFMVFMTSCKYLSEKRMKYVKNNKNYNTFNMFYANKTNKTYFNTVFHSHIKQYPVCVSNTPLQTANQNTTIVMSFNHHIEQNTVEKFKIKKELEKYFKTQVKKEFKYMMSNKLSKNACKVFQKIVENDMWDVININLYDVFTCIHHMIYQNYELLEKTLFNITIYDINETDDLVCSRTILSSLKIILSSVDELHHKPTKYSEITKTVLVYIIYSYCDKMSEIMFKRNFAKVFVSLGTRTDHICFQLQHSHELPECLKNTIINKIKTVDEKLLSYCK